MERRAGNKRTAALILALCSVLCLGGCAHTKPVGQTLTALGALVFGLAVLEAVGVLGSDCANTRPQQDEAMTVCSGNGVQPKALDIVAIGAGAGLIGGGVALWTADSSNPPSPSQTNHYLSTPIPAALFAGQPPEEHAGRENSAASLPERSGQQRALW